MTDLPALGRIRFGCCVLDEGRGALVAPDATETVLRPKTLDLLRLLLRHPGRVVSRNEILDAVWPGLFVTDDSITQCVVELRRAMGGAGADILRTVPRRGYLLQAEVAAEARAPAPAGALPSPQADDRPSIAVLPVHAGAGPDREEAWFTDGIIEGVVHVLAGLDGLFVISRGSALAFARTSTDSRAAARELGVRYVLHAGARRAGGRVRITAELVEAASGRILHSERQDGAEAELFDLQDRVAEAVVATIAPQLREAETARTFRKPPASLTAYDLVLRALDQLRDYDRAPFARAGAFLRDAVAADPGYAQARSYLALWHLLSIGEGWAEDAAAATGRAAGEARAAAALDPTDPLAAALAGHALAYLDRDYQAAARQLDRARRLGPSCAWAWSLASVTTSFLGDTAEAVRQAERGLRLSPLDPFAHLHQHLLSQALYLAGDHEGAASWAARAAAGSPRHGPNNRVLIAALAALGRLEQARAVAARVLAGDPGFRVGAFAARTPLPDGVREEFARRLRLAGLPE